MPTSTTQTTFSSADASTAVEVVAAQGASNKIRIHEIRCSVKNSVTGSLNITFQDDAGTPVVMLPQQAVSPATGSLNVSAGEGFINETTANQALDVLASAAGDIEGYVVWSVST